SGIARLRDIAVPGGRHATGTEPWVLSGESAGLVAHAHHGSGSNGTDLWSALGAKAQRLAGSGSAYLDYPVLGMVLFALGSWGLLRDARGPQEAVRLVVLADRFAYNRMLPSMAWRRIERPAAQAAPGSIARLRSEYGERRGPALLDEARAAVA